jgi:hypothetical protein
MFDATPAGELRRGHGELTALPTWDARRRTRGAADIPTIVVGSLPVQPRIALRAAS